MISLAESKLDVRAAGTRRLLRRLRDNGYTDPRLLRAFASVPREVFVPPDARELACDDIALPIDFEQTISQPSVVAAMILGLDLQPNHYVLEVGTGSGYQSAVMALLCRRVFTLERIRPLALVAEKRLEALGIDNVSVRYGDGFKGWREWDHFDRIVITAACRDVPSVLVDQLAPGGTLVAPVVADERGQDLVRFTKNAEGTLVRRVLAQVNFVPMLRGLQDP